MALIHVAPQITCCQGPIVDLVFREFERLERKSTN